MLYILCLYTVKDEPREEKNEPNHVFNLRRWILFSLHKQKCEDDEVEIKNNKKKYYKKRATEVQCMRYFSLSLSVISYD